MLFMLYSILHDKFQYFENPTFELPKPYVFFDEKNYHSYGMEFEPLHYTISSRRLTLIAAANRRKNTIKETVKPEKGTVKVLLPCDFTESPCHFTVPLRCRR